MDLTETILESISRNLYEQTKIFAKIEKHLERTNILKMTELNSSGNILDMIGGLDGVTDCDFMDAIDMFPVLEETLGDSHRRQEERARKMREYENLKRGVA